MASKQGSSAAKATAVADIDPTYEWVDGDGIYLLRLNLPGFKKEDFRVHVDPAGRLTIQGHGAGGATRIHKVFQLPSTSDLDGITGRYDGSVLVLTVPKLPPPAVPSPPPPQEQNKQGGQDPAGKAATEQPKSRISREAERLIEAARARLPRTRQAKEQSTAERSEMPTAAKEAEEEKKEAPKPKPKPKAEAPSENAKGAAADEHRANVGREAERGIEASRARLQAAAERETTERQEKKGRCWKEEGFKWADAIGNNKEVIATAVAAFTLGVFVSHRLFARN